MALKLPKLRMRIWKHKEMRSRENNMSTASQRSTFKPRLVPKKGNKTRKALFYYSDTSTQNGVSSKNMSSKYTSTRSIISPKHIYNFESPFYPLVPNLMAKAMSWLYLIFSMIVIQLFISKPQHKSLKYMHQNWIDCYSVTS